MVAQSALANYQIQLVSATQLCCGDSITAIATKNLFKGGVFVELKVYNPTDGHDLPIVEWNFLELKKWLEDGLAVYKGRVYDDDRIGEAKKDVAALRKLAKAIDTKRKEIKAVYLEPYTLFEQQAKELTAMVEQQSREIDAQVKAYDERRKQEKLEKIKTELYGPMIGNLAELVPYKKLHDPKWLNVTVGMAAVSSELAAKIDRIVIGLASIDKLALPEDVAAQVKGVFLERGDLSEAIAAKDRIMDERERLERYQATQEATETNEAPECENTLPQEKKAAEANLADEGEVETMQIDFRVWVTRPQMLALREFLTSNNIKYGKVPRK